MNVLLLMGVADSGSWWELLLPVWIIVAIAYFIDLLIRYIKKKRLHHKEENVQNQKDLMNDFTATVDHFNQNQN